MRRGRAGAGDGVVAGSNTSMSSSSSNEAKVRNETLADILRERGRMYG